MAKNPCNLGKPGQQFFSNEDKRWKSGPLGELNMVQTISSAPGKDLIGARKRGRNMKSPRAIFSRCLTVVAIFGMLFFLAGVQSALAQEEPKKDEPKQEEPKTEEPQIVPEQPAYEGAAEEEEGGTPLTFESEITVSGFRYSLDQSLDLKRDAVNTRDSIVIEDIGKMPDLNVAEAIQRVPGVAIVREGGEGRQMSLRGLGPEFTRVTLNGMEVPSSNGGLDSSGGVNRGRAFDFNVFSAELFNRIDINKTAVASIEEGGVSGTVEMYTARPLDNPGFHGAATLQGAYNDLSDSVDPRVTATMSTTNKAETLGFFLTAAYSERTSWQDGFGTVRFDSPALDRAFAGNETDLSNEELNSAWYPRLPRQDSFRHNQDRLGLSATFQFRPTDKLDFGVTWVHSEFNAETNSYNSFAQFRRSGPWGFNTITPTDVTLAPGRHRSVRHRRHVRQRRVADGKQTDPGQHEVRPDRGGFRLEDQ